MIDLFFKGSALWFSIPAMLGTAFLLLRLLGLIIGAGHDGDFTDHVPDVHAGADHHGHGDGMQLISVTGGFGFLAGFGWGGLAALKGTSWDMSWVIATAVASGLAILLLQAFLFRSLLRLQASGNISLSSAVGSEGIVYIEIPGKLAGKGQVTLVVQDRRRQFNAITEGETLPSQTRITVVSMNSDNTLTVRRAS